VTNKGAVAALRRRSQGRRAVGNHRQVLVRQVAAHVSEAANLHLRNVRNVDCDGARAMVHRILAHRFLPHRLGRLFHTWHAFMADSLPGGRRRGRRRACGWSGRDRPLCSGLVGCFQRCQPCLELFHVFFQLLDLGRVAACRLRGKRHSRQQHRAQSRRHPAPPSAPRFLAQPHSLALVSSSAKQMTRQCAQKLRSRGGLRELSSP
jgi:hypothetical protein